MSLRNSQRVGRRRRVLADEKNLDAAPTHRIFRGHEDGPVSPYTQSALLSMQVCLADYLPLRLFSLLVWFLIGLVPIFLLIFLDSQGAAWAERVEKDWLHAFDFTARGNLANWLSSILFALATVVMGGIYNVRKHRRDDYRARFTVWRWAIAAGVFLSIDATAGLRHAWQGGCQHLFETTLHGDGSVWWVGTWSLLFGGLLARLMVEMGRSWPSVGGAAAAACLYFASAWIQLGLVPRATEPFVQTVQTVTLLLGHYAILFTMVLYARHVVLEAMGHVDAPAKSHSQKGSTPQVAGRKRSQTKPRPLLRTVAIAEDAEAADTESDSAQEIKGANESHAGDVHALGLIGETPHDVDTDVARHLSKAERKRLRRDKRKRRAA